MLKKIFGVFINSLGTKGHVFLALNVALMLSSSFLMSQTPLAFQNFISSAQSSAINWSTNKHLFLCALFYLSSSLLRDLQLYTFTFVERAITMNIGSKAFASSFGRTNSNSANFNSFIMSFQNFFGLLFFTLIPVSLDLVFIIFSFNFGFSAHVTSVFVVFLIGYALFSFLSTKHVAKFQKDFFGKQATAFNRISSLFSTQEVLIRYKALGFASESYSQAFGANQPLRLLIGLKRSIQANLVNVWTALFFVLIFVFAMRDIESNHGSFASLIPIEAFFFQALRRLEIYVRSLRETVNNYSNLSNFSEWILALTSKIESSSQNPAITFKRSLSVSPGLTVISGPTGCGKSTLLNQLFRENNEKLNCVYVAQKESFFDATLIDNITLGQKLDVERLNKWIEAFKLCPVVARLPNGLQTELDSRSPMLSGGEIQRFSLVRAFSFDADLFLMDEVTSAQDKEKEIAIFELLQEKSKHVPIVLVSHNPLAKNYADRLITFNSQGEFHELALAVV